MPEAEHDDGADETAEQSPSGGVLSGYGAASAVLGALSLVAVVLLAVIWSQHRDHVDELAYRTDVMQAAADWTGVLINMNADNVDASLQKLRDGSVGQLNADFDATMEPYRDIVRTLQSRTTGQIRSVAIETVHHDLDAKPGAGPAPSPDALPPEMASRTDSVIVVATSVSQNATAKPQTVRWNLRLGVSDVDGALLISRLESLR
ncbi:hypothetical protein [Mycolicibacterium palauense]|uniref:hypothetical protein n=1 Tax=Mycolicibacterium palauense TaxID=2034511 RepID=UPI000BFF0753|nr:hypothetical protein [Mycolicibacterium palauense]